jgi:hypothetical protein
MYICLCGRYQKPLKITGELESMVRWDISDFVKKQLCLTMLFLMNTESITISLAPLRLCVHNFVLLTVKVSTSASCE